MIRALIPHTPAPSSGHHTGIAFSELADDSLALCDRIAALSEEPGCITRTFLSEAMRETHDVLREAMTAAGLAVRGDAAGNLIGRRAGATPDAPALLIGSHIDSVRNAGRYDGVLGVTMALGVIRALGRRPLPFAIDVIAFSEEEGVRYQRPYLGSAAVVGCFDPAWLDTFDDTGVSLREAIMRFGGSAALHGDAAMNTEAAIAAAAYRRETVLGYIECHIEQGPRLEMEGRPLGVVTGIAGQSRMRLRLRGEAGHAGTVPMSARRDALAGAAELIQATETLGKNTPGLMATVGWIQSQPNIPNVISSAVELSLDVRHLDDAVREGAITSLEAAMALIAERRELELTVLGAQHNASIQCDERLMRLLDAAARNCGIEPSHLPSGAGHDAVVMARLCPMAMLFLRCRGGVSHHPEETVERGDVAVGIEALARFVELFKIGDEITGTSKSSNKETV